MYKIVIRRICSDELCSVVKYIFTARANRRYFGKRLFGPFDRCAEIEAFFIMSCILW